MTPPFPLLPPLAPADLKELRWYLEEYMQFPGPGDRVRAEAIAVRFASLRLDQVYATILWYLQDRERLDAYLADWLTASRVAREAQEQNPPPIVLKLRQIKAAQQSAL